MTVAAETGLVGLAFFVWLAFALLRGAFAAPRSALRIVCGLGLAAVFVHSLFYNAFFEDPVAWGLVGLLMLASRVPARREEPVPVPVEHKEAVPV